MALTREEEARRLAILTEGREQGRTIEQMAREAGISAGAFSYWMSKRGHRNGVAATARRPRRDYTWAEHGETILRLRAEGLSFVRIGEQIGIGETMIRKMMGEYAPDVVAAERAEREAVQEAARVAREAMTTPPPTADEIARAAERRRKRRNLHPGVYRGKSGWELHCERCERTPVRVYPSKRRAEKACELHDRCCEGGEFRVWGRVA